MEKKVQALKFYSFLSKGKFILFNLYAQILDLMRDSLISNKVNCDSLMDEYLFVMFVERI